VALTSKPKIDTLPIVPSSISRILFAVSVVHNALFPGAGNTHTHTHVSSVQQHRFLSQYEQSSRLADRDPRLPNLALSSGAISHSWLSCGISRIMVHSLANRSPRHPSHHGAADRGCDLLWRISSGPSGR
jgi:hypothetical protein